MKEKFIRFMQGRYGNDRLNQCLMFGAVIMMVISFVVGDFLYLLALLLLLVSYYRLFSKDISKRTMENQWYLKQEWKVRAFFTKKKQMAAQSKSHHIYKCPNCKQKIRVPKGRGKIEIKCPKCAEKFVKKS